MKEIHIKIIDKMKSLLFLYFCVAMALVIPLFLCGNGLFSHGFFGI